VDRPTSETLEIDPPISNLDRVFVLLNSGNTFSGFNNLQLGSVDLIFSDNRTLTTPLIIGENIREWDSTASGVVNTTSSPNVKEVFHLETAVGKRFVMDMLTISIPEKYGAVSLTGITFNDTSSDTIGSYDPGFTIYGVTIKQK
jgi:hypothetical protein